MSPQTISTIVEHCCFVLQRIDVNMKFASDLSYITGLSYGVCS